MVAKSELIRQWCYVFYAKAMELGTEFTEKTVEPIDVDLGDDLAIPTVEDQSDVQILMKRAAKALGLKDIPHFIHSMIVLDELLRTFKHESFTPEFYDFVSDQDVWDWVHSLQSGKQLDGHDWALASIIKDNLLYLTSLPKLFEL